MADLAPLVIEQTPVRAMLAVPLVHEGQRAGALDIFADTAGAFTDESVGQAAILAAFASVAVAGAAQSERAAARGGDGDQPRDRRGRRHPDGHARHQPGRRVRHAVPASQRLNRKLRDIATGIVKATRAGDSPAQYGRRRRPGAAPSVQSG